MCAKKSFSINLEPRQTVIKVNLISVYFYFLSDIIGKQTDFSRTFICCIASCHTKLVELFGYIKIIACLYNGYEFIDL